MTISRTTKKYSEKGNNPNTDFLEINMLNSQIDLFGKSLLENRKLATTEQSKWAYNRVIKQYNHIFKRNLEV